MSRKPVPMDEETVAWRRLRAKLSETQALLAEAREAIELLVALPVTYNDNRIEIETGSHGESMAIVRKARAFLAKTEVCACDGGGKQP